MLWFKQIHVSYAHTQALKDFDIDGVETEFARLKGTRLALCL